MVPEVRKDCTYGRLAAMQLPKEVKGMDSCEVNSYKFNSKDNLRHKIILHTGVFLAFENYSTLNMCFQEVLKKKIGLIRRPYEHSLT